MKSLDFFQIKLLLRVYNYLYQRISYLSRKINAGIHPKHRIIDYHNYFLNQIKEGSKVLDVGCGIGSLSFDLAKKAKLVTAIDINGKLIKIAKERFQKENIEYIIGDAITYNFKNQYDYIILSNVLEHIKNRTEFLINIQKLADVILIRVPMINRSWIVLYQKELNIDYRLDASHYIEYTFNTFEKEMKSAGLKIISFTIQFGEIWAYVEKI